MKARRPAAVGIMALNLDHIAQGRPCCVEALQRMTPGIHRVILFKQETADRPDSYLIRIRSDD